MQELERFRSHEELRAARVEMAGWYRAVSASDLLRWLEGVRFADGVENGLSLLKAHGVAVGIASITWSFAVEHLARGVGVEYWLGTALLDSGEITHVWPEDKARWVQQLARRLQVPAQRTAAVGDSAGDYDMLGAVGLPVFVGTELSPPRPGWLHRPAESIEWVAKHLLQAWRLAPNEAAF